MGVPNNIDFDRFLQQIDRNSELRSMRVVYFDGARFTVVREGPVMCAPGLKTIIIKPDIGVETLKNAQAAEGRESKLYAELLGGVLGCTSAVLGWVVVVGTGPAVPVSALAVVAASASTIQCWNSGARVYNEMSAPSRNDWLDSQDWYTRTETILDVVSLVGAAASARATIRLAKTLRNTTGKSMRAVLQGLSRQERARITEEIIRSENPGISTGEIKVLIKANKYPKRYTGLQISHAVRTQLKDAMGAAMTFAGSASGGVVRRYAAGIVQSFETY